MALALLDMRVLEAKLVGGPTPELAEQVIDTLDRLLGVPAPGDGDH